MRVYTVHLRRPTLDPDRDVRLIKEGINWPAFFFGFAWALWCRLWLVAIILVAAEVAVRVLLTVLRADAPTQVIVGLGLAAVIGLVANDLHRWTLFRRGYMDVAVVTGANGDMAERRFWDQRPNLAADLVR